VLKRLFIVSLLLVPACSKKEAPPAPSPGTFPPPIDGQTPLPDPLPKIAGKVNGQPIPTGHVEIIAKRLLDESGDQAKDKPFAYRRALQQLVVRELLLQDAIARNLKADDAQVEAAYNEARVPYPDDRAWLSFLAQQGLDADSFRREIRTQKTIAALMKLESDALSGPVGDKELRDYYDSHPQAFDSGERLRAAHILVRVPGDAPAEQKAQLRKKAESLLERIRKGEDFAKLATQYSADPGSAAQGGELGVFHKGQMVPPFEEAAYALKPGEVSGVVETAFGFHIIKLQERIPALKIPFEAAKERIGPAVVEERRSKRLEELVSILWSRARVETNL
jgi:peptidyl-prolyl cis-trans isomerase C